MMLEWLAETQAAVAIRGAVASALADGNRTPDLGGTLTTTQMTASIVERVAR